MAFKPETPSRPFPALCKSGIDLFGSSARNLAPVKKQSGAVNLFAFTSDLFVQSFRGSQSPQLRAAASSHRLFQRHTKRIVSPNISQGEMQSLLIATEESHFLLRILNGSFQTLNLLKDQISHIFTDFFCSKSNLQLDCTQCKSVNVDQYELRAKEWLSEKEEFSDGKGKSGGAVFNALDAMLKTSLDRLKDMRESISWGHSGTVPETNYRKDVTLIRALCLQGKVGAALSLWNKMKGLLEDARKLLEKILGDDHDWKNLKFDNLDYPNGWLLQIWKYGGSPHLFGGDIPKGHRDECSLHIMSSYMDSV
ncbi:pentatricopeptide repeat-containing protein [Forsythia ovata]|uniref:Pentatricopeptide repeat-containing protein n=1 Tax=Forsythia ovata TaxID=205694 RepID=A0ABD1WHA1_9LAMI